MELLTAVRMAEVYAEHGEDCTEYYPTVCRIGNKLRQRGVIPRFVEIPYK